MIRNPRGVVAIGVVLLGLSTFACSNDDSRRLIGSDAGSDEPGNDPEKARCDNLSAADVQGLMTAPVAGMDVSDVGFDNDGQRCTFDDADSEQAVEVIVVPVSDPAVGYDAAKKGADDPVTLANVGDEGFRETGDFDPYAKHGGVFCTVSVSEAIEVPGVDALVMGGTLNLTESQNVILAEALGTVCNRLFGTGNTTPDLSAL